MPLGEVSFSNEGEKERQPLKDVILPLLASLALKWLQIGTVMLLNMQWRRAS